MSLINLMDLPNWISAAQAIELMNVRAQTLYANVSRGKIRTKQDGADSRRRLYHRGDVQRLAGRSRGIRAAEKVATQALEWGTPVLPSAISTVKDGRLWYRGQDAVALAQTCQLEEIAGILWESDTARLDIASAELNGSAQGAAPADALSTGLALMAARCPRDLPTLGRSASTLKKEAAAVLATLLSAMLGKGKSTHWRQRQRTARRDLAPTSRRIFHPYGAVSVGGP